MVHLNYIAAIFYTAILAASCNKAMPHMSLLPQSHIRYFGFTLIDTYWDDPTDNIVQTNYIQEVAPFSNVADILVVTPSDNIMERMDLMNRHQVKCIFHLNNLFFEQVGTASPSGVEYALRIDFAERWDTFVNLNRLQNHQEGIQAFYLGEEPTWNGISYQDLKEASDYIDGQFPDVPILLIEAYPVLDRLRVPNSTDWIGFSHYFLKDPATDPEYQKEWATLRSKRSSDHQRLVVIMDAHYIDEIHRQVSGILLEDLADVADSYYRLAKSDTSVIAILSYFWPNGFDVNGSIGARGMPLTVREKYWRIGKEITGK